MFVISMKNRNRPHRYLFQMWVPGTVRMVVIVFDQTHSNVAMVSYSAACMGNSQNGGHCILPNTCECCHSFLYRLSIFQLCVPETVRMVAIVSDLTRANVLMGTLDPTANMV